MGIRYMPVKKFRSLSFKLTLWYIIILGLILGLSGIFLYSAFRENLLNDLDNTLLEIANDAYEAWYRRRGVSWQEAIAKTEDRHRNIRPLIQMVTLADDHNKKGIEDVIRSDRITDDAFLLDVDVYYRADRVGIDDLVYLTIEEESLSEAPIRVILFPIRGPNQIQVGIAVTAIEGALNQLILTLLVAGPLVMLLASFGGVFIIRKALKPVRSVVQTARNISADDLSFRIEAGGRNDEIGALVETFNDMIARLETSVKKIRQFSGDVSHELRTPLTAIRGEIEVTLRKTRERKEYHKTLRSVLEDTCRLEKIIDDLLFLSRVEVLKKKEFSEDLSLDDMLLKAFEDKEPLARKKDQIFEISEMAPVRMKGDPSLLERLAANLIDNAIRYTPSGGKITLSLTPRDGHAVLAVSDTGVGIPEAAIPHIFDRFYVVDPSRSRESGGSGLGLSIVKWIADLHGAVIEVDSRVDQGTTFRIRFPVD